MSEQVDSLGKIILGQGQPITVTHEAAAHRGLRGVVISYDNRTETYGIAFENGTRASYTRDDFMLGATGKAE